MRVQFHALGTVAEDMLAFAVIMAEVEQKWVFVKHKQRLTWEIPGGHNEKGESIAATAARELREEAGAVDFQLHPVSEYSVCREGQAASFGRLYFAAVKRLGPLPPSEIGEVTLLTELPERLTYPEIQPHLFVRVQTWLADRNQAESSLFPAGRAPAGGSGHPSR